MGKKELNWISKHPKEIEKYSGRWVALKADDGILASGYLLNKVIEKTKRKEPKAVPCVFKVPRKDEEEFVL